MDIHIHAAMIRLLLIGWLLWCGLMASAQFTCGDTVTDSRDGQKYPTVQIGTQCWMTKNMNIGTPISGALAQTDNDTIEKYCYDNDTNYCNKFGGLYQWAEMVQYYLGVTNTTHWNPVPTGNVQGICPEGWHIPKKTESDALLNGLVYATAGTKMKDTSSSSWYRPDCANYPHIARTNESGFTAVGSGARSYAGNVFMNIGQFGFMWTVTRGGTNPDAFYYGAGLTFAAPYGGQAYKTSGYAVRCLKD